MQPDLTAPMDDSNWEKFSSVIGEDSPFSIFDKCYVGCICNS